MVRKTSIAAFNNIKENGLLSERRFQVYNSLFDCGPATGGEVFEKMREKYGVLIPVNSNTITRLGELRELGVAEELGERVCSISGQNVILWDVTDRLPVKYEKPRSEAWRLLKRVYDEVNPAFMSPKLNEDIKKYLKL